MSNLLLTLAIAFIIVAGAVMLMAIGWILTGKSKIKAGACGRDPNQKRDESCGSETKTSCGLCKKTKDDQ